MNRDQAREQLAALMERYHAARRRSASDPGLAARMAALAAFQAQRLAATYADLRRTPRHRAAVDFFLNDLYGPQDLTARDDQIIKALGKLQRFLPAAALGALAHAFELHVLTIELDTATAARLPGRALPEAAAYAAAYRAAGRSDDRRRQIDLVGEIGGLLDSIAHRPEVGLAVRLARGPAHAAGYGLLQDFLERGYEAFRRMKGAEDFLEAITSRESRLMGDILAGAVPAALAGEPPAATAAKGGRTA